MKVFTFLLLAIPFFFANVNAQTGQPSSTGKCLTDLMLQKQALSDPFFRTKQQVMDKMIASYQHAAARTTMVTSIPVVVHVIHSGGTENIPDAQIIDGIAHLNAAFANSGFYAHINGVNTTIQFCLAQQDPNGSFTNGITRTVSPLTNVIAENDDAALKSLIQWDSHLYLNIWLVKEITSLSLGPAMAGYATLPSSHGQLFDGIVNEAGLFGSTIDNSKVHIHEAGHYLGLYHTFEGGCVNNDCQADGDKVCDTPPDNSTAPVACNATNNTCVTDADDISINNPFRPVALGGLGDQTDMFENYMDYGYQSCQAYFTNGQSTRMNAALSTTRQSLLLSNGCTSACTIPIALNISANDSSVYIGTAVQFNSIISGATILDWKVNNVSASSAGTFTYTFNTPGTYTVSLTGTNADANCYKTVKLYIRVNCTSEASFQFATPGPYLIGTTVSITNTSLNSTTAQWFLDGLPAGTTTDWSQLFNAPGGHSIYLVTANSLCHDTSSTSFFQVGNCNLSGITNHWVVNGNHFNFSSGSPSNTGGSPFFAANVESSSSISDRDGNLLFFSDGLNCWDKTYQLMPNGSGLLGHYSSTQGVLITPHPGNPNQYYVFTNDAIENNFANGLRYSIVDMSLNSGMGDIIPATKNTLLTLGGSEKMAAVWHANGHDIWLATAMGHSNAYHSFLIDPAGIHAAPVISNIGPAMNLGLSSMTFSQDGNRMAASVVSAWPWRILVADFNKSTGQFSHPIELVLSSLVNEQVFSLLFSPDNSKLYASLIQGSDILQYDLSQTTASQIMASRVAVDPYPSTSFGHLALGKNGKIYVHAQAEANSLSVINSPNLVGTACNYQQIAVPLLPTSSAFCLPNMLQGFSAFNPAIAGPKAICVGGISYQYGIFLESSTDVAVWTHNGPGTFVTMSGSNTATLISSSSAGIDTVRVAITGGCGISYDTLMVYSNAPEIGLLADTTYLCDSVMLSPGTDFLSYAWQDASNDPNYKATHAGTYWVNMKGASGCIVSDTTHVLINPVIPVSLGSDKTVCQGQIVTLQPNHHYDTYEWQDGSSNSTLTAYHSGKYWITVWDLCHNTSSDTIRVIATQANLHLNYNGSDTICSTALPFILSAPTGFDHYLWSDGSSAQTYTVTGLGAHSLTATDAQGCYAADTIWVKSCSVVTGLQEYNQNNIYCFPNPANDQVTLISLNSLGTGLVKVYSSIGSLVYSAHWSNQRLDIPTTQLAEGIYFIQTELHTFKVLVSHYR